MAYKEVSPYTENQTKIIEIFSDAFSESNEQENKGLELVSVEIVEREFSGKELLMTMVKADRKLDKYTPLLYGEIALIEAGYGIPTEYHDLDIAPADST